MQRRFVWCGSCLMGRGPAALSAGLFFRARGWREEARREGGERFCHGRGPLWVETRGDGRAGVGGGCGGAFTAWACLRHSRRGCGCPPPRPQCIRIALQLQSRRASASACSLLLSCCGARVALRLACSALAGGTRRLFFSITAKGFGSGLGLREDGLEARAIGFSILYPYPFSMAMMLVLVCVLMAGGACGGVCVVAFF